MCIDSACRPEDVHKPVGLYPCHNQGGNQVTEKIEQAKIMKMGKKLLWKTAIQIKNGAMTMSTDLALCRGSRSMRLALRFI